MREAINWAIDEEALTEKILQGEGIPGTTVVPPALAKYHLELPESEIQGFDIERSKELLKQAGWEDTNGDGTVDKDGEELELRLFVRSEDKRLGDGRASSSRTGSRRPASAWRPRPWATPPLPTPSTPPTTTCSSGAGARKRIPTSSSRCSPATSSWAGPTRSGATTTTPACTWSRRQQLDLDERAATIKEMQRIAYEDNPYVIFYYDNQFEAWRTDKFEGWTKTPTNADPGQVAFTFSTETYTEPASPSARAARGMKEAAPSPLLYIGIGIVAIAVIAGIVYFLRRGSAEDRA